MEEYTGGCECSDEWFVINIAPFGEELKIDICSYNADVIIKPLLKVVAIFLLVMFYREYMFKAIMESF